MYSAHQEALPASAPAPPAHKAHLSVSRSFECQCGQPIFFRNSICLSCQTQLGYDPEHGVLVPLAPQAATTDIEKETEGVDATVWRSAESAQSTGRYVRCDNLGTAAACNWLIPLGDAPSSRLRFCLSCRLTRRIPDLSADNNAVWWGRIETAKRRMVSSLMGMQLPVVPWNDDPQRGLAFDILASVDGTPVVTGHDDGVITLDAQEADDPTRELRRTQLLEPYRTLLGHLRHEIGHYYWRRLVENTDWLDAFRRVFGDERADYPAALQRHYSGGAPVDWNLAHVSAYASCHPWEDWAETWAHYLHMTDTLDTATSFGILGERLELVYEPFGTEIFGDESDAHVDTFLPLLNQWMRITGVLNELSRSMGMPDFYPFVLSAPTVRKLHLVHQIIQSAHAQWNPQGGCWSQDDDSTP